MKKGIVKKSKNIKYIYTKGGKTMETRIFKLNDIIIRFMDL